MLEVGLLKRTFDEYDVRFIAANDNFDTANGFDIMSIFRDVFNEWFVADTSKKIRAVFKAKAQAGKHSNSVAPYGYKPSETDKFVWAIDEPAAEVVRDIFQMCIDGIGPKYIAKELGRRGLKIPQVYKAERDGVPLKHIPKYSDTDWHASVVNGILANREYTGRAILNRKTSKSYKDHKKYIKPEDEWIIHENAHPAIIDDETFTTVQRIHCGRRRVQRTYDKGALADVLYCADCGCRLYVKHSSRKNPDGTVREYCYYVCQNSRTYTEYATCTSHTITRENVEEVVLGDLRRVLSLAKSDERAFVAKLYKASAKEAERGVRKMQSELSKGKARIAALDRIISRIYEDNVEGRISNERFQTMLSGYEAEQAELKEKANELSLGIDKALEQTTSIESFLKLVRTCTEITTLTPGIVHEFIKRIEVGKPEYTPARFNHWARGKTQKVKIVYNYIDDVSSALSGE